MRQIDAEWAGPATIVNVELADPPDSIRPAAEHERAVVFFRDHGAPVNRCEMTAVAGVVPEAVYQGSLEAARGAATVCAMSRSSPPADGLRPAFSVAVCTHDRADAAMATIKSLEALDYDGPVEILIVDNAPTDDALERALEAHRSATASSVKRLVEPVPGLSRARNRALQCASGELIAFTDDDALAEPRWLETLAAAFSANPNAGCVTGIALPAEIETPAQDLAERFNGLNGGRGFESNVYNQRTLSPRHPLYPFPTYGAGVNMAFRRSILADIGGFCTSLGVGTGTGGGEDTAIFAEVLLSGYDIVFEPAAVVHHRHRREMSALVTQMRGYGMGVTAYLTWCLHKHPRESLGLLRMTKPAVVYLMSGGRSHQDENRDVVPQFLRRAVRGGLPLGPWAYVRAVLAESRRP